MYWICFGDSAKGALCEARHDIAPELTADHILALQDDYAQGDISDVSDRAAREAVIAPWRGDPELDGSWMDELIERHFVFAIVIFFVIFRKPVAENVVDFPYRFALFTS